MQSKNKSFEHNECRIRRFILFLQYKETTHMVEERFTDILTKTERRGIDSILTKLKNLGFFEAPASSRFHLSFKGGLAEHSMNVYEAAMMLREQIILKKPELEEQLPLDSIAICALLHDVCKTDIYKEGILSRKNDDGYWEKYVGYSVDYNNALPLGHGEKSVILLLSWGLELKPEEMLAIRWHMGPWDLAMQSAEQKESLNAAKAKSPLVSLIQLSDGIATGLLER